MNANLKRLICHFQIPRLVMLFMLAWVRPALGDGLGNSTLQYTGIVVDEQGRPVAGATVDCYRYQSSEAWFDNAQAELEQKQQTATDGRGAFAIPAWPGRTLVVVQKSGLAPAWKIWSAELSESSEPLVFTAPTTLSGVVVDTNGQPAADAEVWAANAITGDRNTPAARLKMLSGKAAKDCFSARTSADGHFLIQNFPKDAHATLAVRKSGLAQYPIGSSFGWWETASGQNDIELMLGPAGSVEGKVIDQATGRPIAGAKVLVYPRTGPDASSEPVLTGADGTFHVSDLRPDLYYGQVTFPGQPLPDWVWVPENVSAYVVAGKTASNIVLHGAKGALVQVTVVVTNTLQPIAQAWVSAGQATACTDSNGMAWLRASAGQNWISATRSDWSKQQRKVEIVDGQINQFRIEMVPPPHISGIVRDPSGKPAAGVLVSFHPGRYPNAPYYEETNTDQNGRYEMTIRQDSLTVAWDGTIDPTNFVLARDLKRNLAAIEKFGSGRTDFAGLGAIPPNLDLNLQPGISFSGSVVDTKGAPITNALVDFLIQASQSSFLVDDKPLKTDAHGSFSISALPQGLSYMISQVTAEGYGSAFKWLNAKETQTNRYLFPPLVLKRADRILAGQVLGPDGQPVPGASVSFGGTGQRAWTTTKTDRRGHFLFDAVCEGEVQLSAVAFLGGPPGANTVVTSGGGPGIKAQGGDTNIVINLQKQNNAGGNDRTPLHDAAKNGDINEVKFLLDGKADVNAKDLAGRTPLHEAARAGHFDVVALLLTDKADIRARDTFGGTPLHDAAYGGNADIVALLLAHGADVNARANNGVTPLHSAAMFGHTGAVKVLLAHGADVNAMNGDGELPLYGAVRNQHTMVAGLLRQHGGVEHGYQLNHPDQTVTNWNAAELRDAIRNDDLKAVKSLLKANPSLISSRDVQDRTPLILAAMAGHTNLVEVLLANKADLQATDMFGRTALHWAAVLAQCDMAQLLLADGADINARKKGGDTPLHEAAHGGHTNMVEMVGLLLAHGADINVTNDAGGTPLREVVADINRRLPPNLPATAVAGFSMVKEREKGVADFLRQHGGHE